MLNSHSAKFINSSSDLSDFCAELVDAKWIAVDTEFLRDKTYYPIFCLLQIASSQSVACIDPIAINSLEPLEDILFNPNIVKVLHSGRQDLEIFYRYWKKLPAPIFDTQIAAPLIGLGDQISYANLISELLGITLRKGHTRTDWSQRPLSSDQLEYAADDVIYLGAAYLDLQSKLEALDRLDWLENDFAALLNPVLYESPIDQAWLKISGYQYLQDYNLAILQALASWREATARELDIPRGWVVKDENLIDLARVTPQKTEQLRQIRGLDDRCIKRFGEAVVATIIKSRSNQPRSFHIKPPNTKATLDRESLADLLGAVIRIRAAKHTLNPNILATRKDIEQFLDNPNDSKLLTGWRKTMAGEELLAILRGECQVSVIDGSLHVSKLNVLPE